MNGKVEPFSNCPRFFPAIVQSRLHRGETMRSPAILAAAILLIGSSACGYAQTKTPPAPSKGASEFSPGHEMKDSATKDSRGASEFSPGDRMKDTNTTGRAASEFSPGDRMNDTRTKR
jgi:hypothetical protein